MKRAAASRSPAKLTPPTLPVVLERTRLFRLLDRARRRPIVWVSAPPGYGKTTLVASYLRARKLRALWYQVDPGDSDPATLFHYLTLAAQRAAPRARTPLPRFSPEFFPGLLTFARRFFEQWCARLTTTPVVVLDNYQEVPWESQFHQIVRAALSRIPAGLCVVVISREPPPPSLARLQANQLMDRLHEHALSLTRDESRAIVRLHASTQRWRPPARLLDKVDALVQGWVAGLVMLLEQVKRQPNVDAGPSMQTPDALFGYLAREVLAGLSTDRQHFLLKTAFLPNMTGVMAARLTGLGAAEAVLEELYQRRYFTERREGRPPLYQYHPLFREFLEAKAWETFGPVQVGRIRRAAARLLEEAHRTDEAVGILMVGREFDELAQIIQSQAPALLAQGRAHTLEKWVRSLPQERVKSTPWLLFWLANVRFAFAPQEAQQLFEQAYRRFQAEQDRRGTLLAWCGIVEAIVYQWDSLGQLDDWLKEVPTLSLEREPSPDRQTEVRVAAALVSALMWRRPQDSAVRVWISRATALLEQGVDLRLATPLGSQILLYYKWMGEVAEATRLFGILRKCAASASGDPVTRHFLYVAEIPLRWSTGEFELCDEVIRACVQEAMHHGLTAFAATVRTSEVYTALHRGDTTRAEQVLKALRTQMEHAPGIAGAHCEALCGWVALARADFHQAEDHLNKSLKNLSDMGGSVSQALVLLALAQARHGLGDTTGAADCLDRVKRSNADLGSRELQLSHALTTAQFALDQGNEGLCLQALRVGMGIGRTHAIWECEFPLPRFRARLCAKALEAGIEVEYVRRYIRKRNIVPDRSALLPESWPWRLAITTLPSFALAIDGRPFRFSRKLQRRPLLLLKALIVFGGRSVPVSRLADALWPDAEGDAAYAAFTMTLKRLRQLLKADDLLQLQDGRLSLNQEACWVDALAFEELLNEVQAMARHGRAAEAARLRECALRLYHGSFLSEDGDEPWIQQAREHLRRQYVRHVERLAAYWEAQGEWQRIVALVEEAVAVEPLIESFYQRGMAALAHLGRKAEAVALYEECRATFRAQGGLEPSLETNTLCRNLQQAIPPKRA